MAKRGRRFLPLPLERFTRAGFGPAARAPASSAGYVCVPVAYAGYFARGCFKDFPANDQGAKRGSTLFMQGARVILLRPARTG